jgi:hypothetical protein
MEAKGMTNPETGGRGPTQRETNSTPAPKEGRGFFGFHLPIPRHNRLTLVTAGGPDITGVRQGLQEQGGTIFKAVRTDRRTEGDRITTLPRPPWETPTPTPEPEKSPEFPERQGRSSKKAFIARLARVLLGGPAVNHHINYEPEITPPAIGRDIASIPGFYWDLGKGAVEDIQRLLGLKEATVPPTFDNNIEKQIMILKAGVNAIPVTIEEINSMSKQGGVKEPVNKPPVIIDAAYPPTEYIDRIPGEVTALFPVKLKPEISARISAEYTKNNTVESYDSNGAVVKITKFSSYPIWQNIELNNAKGAEISAGMLEGIGTVKSIMLFRNPYPSQQNVPEALPYHNSITVRLTTEEGPIYDVKIQSSDDDIRQIVPLDIVKNAPILPEKLSTKGNPKQWTQEDAERQGTFVNPDTPLLRVNYDNIRIIYSIIKILPNSPVGQQFILLGNIKWSADNNNQFRYISP